MSYHLGWPTRRPPSDGTGSGGKGVRPALAVLSAAAAGRADGVGVLGAVAVELVHNFSLLHDDVIDGDEERRHRPTVWAVFGIGHADHRRRRAAALAHQVLLEASARRTLVRGRAPPRRRDPAMIAGQAPDMAFEAAPSVTVDECLAMEHGKTGALLSCAASIGAVLAGADDAAVDALADFGDHLGLAFQAIDDLLGIWGEPAVTGKPVGSDLLAHKKSAARRDARRAGGPERRRAQAILAGELTDGDVAAGDELIDDARRPREVTTIADARLDAALAALDRVASTSRPRTSSSRSPTS